MTSPEVRSNGQKKTGSLVLCKSKRRALGLMAYSELVVNKPRASSVAVISHHTPGQEGSKGPVGCCSNKGYQPEIQTRLVDCLGGKAGSALSRSTSRFTKIESLSPCS